MRVLFVTFNDYSNLCYNYSQSLKSVGINSIALTLSAHKFGYPQQSILTNRMNMIKQMRIADLIIIGHSYSDLLQYIPRGKRIWVIHTGTPYRQNHEEKNRVFNPVVERTFTDSPEFMTLGAKNITYIAAAIDIDKIQYRPKQREKLIFAHYPSNPESKGTKHIQKLLRHYSVKFICDETILPHEKNLERIADCDVYIEMLNANQFGKPYGSFGVTAFEAAAMGKIVVTNSTNDNVYSSVYGSHPMQIANNGKEFQSVIQSLMNSNKISEMQKEHRDWIVTRHSLKATGEYLKKFL